MCQSTLQKESEFTLKQGQCSVIKNNFVYASENPIYALTTSGCQGQYIGKLNTV